MKIFHISDVLSVTTPFLLSERHMEGVYDILGFLCGEQLWTHQLPRVKDEVTPWMRAQYPELMEDHPSMTALVEKFQAGIDDCADRNVFCRDFVKAVQVSHGLPEMLPLEPMDREMHTSIDPISELQAMVGEAKVIVVSTEAQ